MFRPNELSIIRLLYKTSSKNEVMTC